MSDQNYDANDMQHLEGLDSVRKRIGMYLGDSGDGAYLHTVYEIFDNAVDEAIAGYCTDITVTLHENGAVEVEDNGRGIPTAIHKKTGLPAVIAVFTLLHFGGKFGGSGYAKSGGLHGIGSSATNAVSSRLDFTVKRDGEVVTGSFQRGKPGKFSGEGPDAKFTPHPPQTLTTVRKMKKGEQTGTTVRYWHDKTIFLPGTSLDTGAIRQRLRQTAFLIPGLTLTLNDHLTHPDHPKTETFKYDGGIVDMVDVTSHDTKICDTLHIQGSGTFKETVPMLNKDGEMVSTEMERTVDVDVALRWGNGYDTHIKTFVNVVATPNGGTHLKGFERALVQTLRKAYDGTRLLKANDDPPILEDFEEGLTAVVSIGVPEPQFVGQTKEELGTAGVTKVVQTVVAEGLSAWVNGKKKTQVRTVLEKVANASKVRVAHRTQKDAARRKTALEGASMPAKLVDCRAIGVEGSEIFVVEGDSALGSARQGRNSEYQALLPIRGKILNVQKASLKQMLDNTECASIIQVLGAGSGKTFDLEQMRYSRLIIFADADKDGQHIACLCITLAYKYLRGLVEAGRLFSAMPPLFKVETMGRNKEKFYVHSNKELDVLLARLKRERKQVKFPIQRYKGLGEMDAEELWETTMDPATRSIKRITVSDAEAAEEMLELLMGNNVPNRRDYIVENSDEVEDLDI